MRAMLYDVIIIGGGLGGLACGTILSRAGKSVLVLERGAQAGGALQSYRRGGLIYDTGFHCVGALGEGQSLRRLFDCLGLMSLPWQQLDPDGADRVMIGSDVFMLASGRDELVATLAHRFPKERPALERYVHMLTTCDADPARMMQTSAYGYLTETFRDPLLINVLSGASMRMELRPDTLPLFTFAHCTAPYVESSWRLRGDGGMVARRLVQSIEENGGRVECAAEVEELVESGGRITAARCRGGDTFGGRSFISSLHPASTCRLVTSGLRDIYRRRVTSVEDTAGMLTVSLKMKPRRVPYFNCNLYIYRRPNVWTFADDVGGVGGVMVSARVPANGQWAEQIDLLTPVGCDWWQRWRDTTVGRRPTAYEHAKCMLADECIMLAERLMPGLSDKYDGRYISTPLTWNHYTATPRGTAYGIRKDFHHPHLTMLSVRTPIPNLLLTGQSLALHGVHGVTRTAFETCAQLLGHDYIDQMINSR